MYVIFFSCYNYIICKSCLYVVVDLNVGFWDKFWLFMYSVIFCGNIYKLFLINNILVD